MQNRRYYPLTLRHTALATAIALASLSAGAAADTPQGWISADNYGAYTLGALDFELHLGALVANESNDDVYSGNSLLEGEDRDINGSVVDLQFGITSYLTAFYQRQDTELSVDFDSMPAANIVSMDEELKTESSAYGLKWNIYESGRGGSRAWTATSLELTFSEGSSDDFIGTYNSVIKPNGAFVPFGTDGTFALQDMEDEAWKVRLLHTAPLSRTITGTLWAGYSETEATASTSFSLSGDLTPDQNFETETAQFTLGGSINWQIMPRMPLQISYEYININDRDDTISFNAVGDVMPDFLRAANVTGMDEEENHILTGSLSYWITPHITVSLTCKLFSNQFLGVTPHYHNPLTASFATESYGYAGLNLGIKI